MMADLISALGLVFVIEGCFIAISPEHCKKIMLKILDLPNNHLKITGLISAALGLAIVSIAKGL